MRIAALSVRTRLTLWHAGALTLIVCVFAVGVLLFVRARLYRTLDEQIRDLQDKVQTNNQQTQLLTAETTFPAKSVSVITASTPAVVPVVMRPAKRKVSVKV